MITCFICYELALTEYRIQTNCIEYALHLDP
jgi:hypothetical protein